MKKKEEEIKKNVLSWFGHVERMSDERMAKKIYDRKVSKILEEGHVGLYLLLNSKKTKCKIFRTPNIMLKLMYS